VSRIEPPDRPTSDLEIVLTGCALIGSLVIAGLVLVLFFVYSEDLIRGAIQLLLGGFADPYLVGLGAVIAALGAGLMWLVYRRVIGRESAVTKPVRAGLIAAVMIVFGAVMVFLGARR
jgi:hypothetical protein